MGNQKEGGSAVRQSVLRLNREFAFSILVEMFLIIMVLVFCIPLYFMLINSFKTFGEITMNAASLPEKLVWKNYAVAVKQVKFFSVFVNSISITAGSLFGMVVLGAMASWKLARVQTWVSRLMFFLYVSAMVIPFQSVMIPLVKVAFTLQLIDSRLGLIFIYFGFGLPFTIFLYHGFVKGVPFELEESGRLEGCSDIQLFIHIVIPLLKTITVTVIILQTLWVWNDFLLPSLILHDRDLHTIPLGINRFFGQYRNQWDKALATLVLSMLPIIVFFLFLQKHLIRGVADGALKG